MTINKFSYKIIFFLVIIFVFNFENVNFAYSDKTEIQLINNQTELKKSVINARKWVSLNSIVPNNNDLIAYEAKTLKHLSLANKEEKRRLIHKNFNSNSNLTSLFAYRIHPVTGLLEHHNGIDIPIKEGSNVYSYDAGVVIDIDENIYSNAGKYISILHGDGFKSYYMHLSKIIVEKGQIISKGDLIGYSGSTGRTTGPHLHFELRKNNLAVNPLLIGNVKWYIKSY